jgi:ankyrin repeat protein
MLYRQDKRGSFPLLEAPHSYDTRMGALQALLEAGADVNKQTYQGVPLVPAALEGTPAKIKLLLAAGADPHISVNGQGPLHAAVSKDDLAAIKVHAHFHDAGYKVLLAVYSSYFAATTTA